MPAVCRDNVNYFERAGVESQPRPSDRGRSETLRRAARRRRAFDSPTSRRNVAICVESRNDRPPFSIASRIADSGRVGAQEIADFRRVAVNLARRQEDGRQFKPDVGHRAAQGRDAQDLLQLWAPFRRAASASTNRCPKQLFGSSAS